MFSVESLPARPVGSFLGRLVGNPEVIHWDKSGHIVHYPPWRTGGVQAERWVNTWRLCRANFALTFPSSVLVRDDGQDR